MLLVAKGAGPTLEQTAATDTVSWICTGFLGPAYATPLQGAATSTEPGEILRSDSVSVLGGQ